MLGFYQQKYADAAGYMLLKSLTYFEDAETEPQPEMLFDVSWQQIKHFYVKQLKVIPQVCNEISHKKATIRYHWLSFPYNPNILSRYASMMTFGLNMLQNLHIF